MTSKTRNVLLLLCGLTAAGSIAATAMAQSRSAYPYDSGKELYEHICQGCHMPDGKGAQGSSSGYPALAGNANLEAEMYPVLLILRGQKAMPPFGQLNDAQVAAVTNYIRSSFGNHFSGTVTADQVKELRPDAVQQSAQRPG